ncbi:branched-chain amino acid ABC transporter permease [Chloroflexota bacterium]
MMRSRGVIGQLAHRYGQLGLFALLLALLPILVRSPYWISTMIFVGLYTILTVGLCLLVGYAGQISLGTNAFFGLGAYASAIITTRLGLSPWLGILISMALTGILGAGLAKPVFRLKGQFLALATLGLGVIFYIMFNEASTLTGGPSGIAGVPYLAIGSHRQLGIVFDQDIETYYLVWGAATVTLLISLNLVNSRLGRALRAIHDSEIATQTLGADTARLKTQIFVIGCVYAGLAGSLYAHYVTFVSPSPFGLHMSLMLLVMAAIGGMGTVWGAPFGAAVVTLLTEFLRSVVPKLSNHASGEYEIIVFGVLLIVIMRWMPEGVVQKLSRFFRRRLKARPAATPASGTSPLLAPVPGDGKLTQWRLGQENTDVGSDGGRF